VQPVARPSAFIPGGSDDYREQLDFALAAGKMGTWEYRIPEQRVVWSPAIEQMHGLAVGSFPGTFEAYQEDIHPEDKPAVLASIQRVLSERKEHELSYRIVRPDGEVRWLQAFGRLLCDEAGNPTRLVGVCRDITAEKDAEQSRARLLAAQVTMEEAQRGQQRLIEILESIADPFSVLDEELRITFINGAALKLGGFTR
jgi:PAS domain S-box-containing protein